MILFVVKMIVIVNPQTTLPAKWPDASNGCVVVGVLIVRTGIAIIRTVVTRSMAHTIAAFCRLCRADIGCPSLLRYGTTAAANVQACRQ